MKQHFENPNKDRSIFRKNIGRAVLNKDNNPLLKYWNLDLTNRANKDKYFDADLEKERQQLESWITNYLHDNMSFVVFPVNTKEERLRLEEAIISTLYQSEDFQASKDWLGNYVLPTKANHVKDARMWLSQGIKAKALTDEEMDKLYKICEVENESSIDSLH